MEMHTTQSRTESINGIQMYYEIHGQGEPLILLHGFTGVGSNWASFANSWAKDFQLIIPDLRGHGRSTNSSGEFTFRQSALDVFVLLDRLGVEKFKAVGLSGGAKTLLHMATQQPQRVEAMVLASAAPYFPPQARAIMSQMSPDNRSDEEWQLMRQWHQRADSGVVGAGECVQG